MVEQQVVADLVLRRPRALEHRRVQDRIGGVVVQGEQERRLGGEKAQLETDRLAVADAIDFLLDGIQGPAPILGEGSQIQAEAGEFLCHRGIKIDQIAALKTHAHFRREAVVEAGAVERQQDARRTAGLPAQASTRIQLFVAEVVVNGIEPIDVLGALEEIVGLGVAKDKAVVETFAAVTVREIEAGDQRRLVGGRQGGTGERVAGQVEGFGLDLG